MTTILLVDDDPLQAFVRKSILEKRFSNVFRAADAAEALCLVEEPKFAEGLGLVISGLNLPGIGGPAFVSELHSRLPSVPVLVLGGASEGPSDYAGEPVRFLPRRTTPEELLAIAGQMLGQNGH
jgi:DNA-binding NtrC family response regulator